MSEFTAPLVSEINTADVMLGRRGKKSWDFMKDGKPCAGSREWIVPCSKSADTPLLFTLTDVKCSNGIRATVERSKVRAFMSLNLTPEQSALLKAKIDKPLFDAVYTNRNQLLPKELTGKMKAPDHMAMVWAGIVGEGKEKSDGTGNWPDQITMDVPMIKSGDKAALDENSCQIETLDGDDFPWNDLKGKMLDEVVIEVKEVKLPGKNIGMQCEVRLIALDAKPRAKITTRRRREVVESPEDADDQAAIKADAKRDSEPISEPNAKRAKKE